jgi:Uncharacterized protein conserved in bacteria
MQFIIVAYDGKDEKALERRMAVREAHLQSAKSMFDEGKLLYASGILTDEGKMIGSMMIADFPTLEDMKEQWLNKEPYITGKVWHDIDIKRAGVAPFCLINK